MGARGFIYHSITSLAHRPQACNCTSNSPAPISGTGRSTIRTSSLLWYSTANIVFIAWLAQRTGSQTAPDLTRKIDELHCLEYTRHHQHSAHIRYFPGADAHDHAGYIHHVRVHADQVRYGHRAERRSSAYGNWAISRLCR